MSTIPNVSPSTLDGIKRKAKSFGRENNLSHLAALDVVAQQSGYDNFHHARRALQRTQGVPSLHSIFLSAYWSDASAKPRSAGLEILEIKLPRPLTSFLSKHQCGHAQNLQGFFAEYSDHLEMRGNVETQERARERLTRAALTLQFIEATGLRPVTTQRQRAAMKNAEKLPSSDHVSRWISAETGDWLILDEPYDHVTTQPELGRREEWVSANDLHWAKPTWSGLYYPGNAVPHILTSNLDLLNQTVKTIERMSDASLKQNNEWVIQTDVYQAQFLSPARKLEGKKRKPRLGTTYGSSKNAIEFQWNAGHSPRRRPAKAMSMKNHKELGKILKRLSVSRTPINAHSKILGLKSDLEDWMFAEYRGKGRKDVDVDVYYGGKDIKGYSDTAKMLEAVDLVRSTLLSAYPDSKPLRDQLKSLDAARSYIANASS
ncbi:DUF5623 domain-containing protein [Pseudomonas proteolytica]|uniref:DUF5623 domain-containing protein n=1 Tax=Pseudomonas proteolytica TaxID=219574 RepID=UPI001473E121|nr:DUF5623 domain-containing protein [Pseudomonas proteolytica]NMZ34011.1 DUF5623 domain-containing protein [Pseudomonas proteolytica]